MVLANGIVKPSVALKSTSANIQYLASQSAGEKAEKAVITWMQQKQWQLLFQRASTYIAEIDLIFQKNNRIVLIEVKKLNHSWRAFERIELKQTQKLQMNLVYLSRKYKDYQFYAHLCWVDQKNQVYFVDLN